VHDVAALVINQLFKSEMEFISMYTHVLNFVLRMHIYALRIPYVTEPRWLVIHKETRSSMSFAVLSTARKNVYFG